MQFDEILESAKKYYPEAVYENRRVDGLLFHVETLPGNICKTVFICADENGLNSSCVDLICIRADEEITLRTFQAALDNLNDRLRNRNLPMIHASKKLSAGNEK